MSSKEAVFTNYIFDFKEKISPTFSSEALKIYAGLKRSESEQIMLVNAIDDSTNLQPNKVALELWEKVHPNHTGLGEAVLLPNYFYIRFTIDYNSAGEPAQLNLIIFATSAGPSENYKLNGIKIPFDNLDEYVELKRMHYFRQRPLLHPTEASSDNSISGVDNQ